MKKQLLAFAIFTLGFITISEAKNKNRERYAEVVKGGIIIIKSKNPPVVPPGCTVSRYKSLSEKSYSPQYSH